MALEWTRAFRAKILQLLLLPAGYFFPLAGHSISSWKALPMFNFTVYPLLKCRNPIFQISNFCRVDAGMVIIMPALMFSPHPSLIDIPLSLPSIQASSQPGSVVQDQERETQKPAQVLSVEGDGQEPDLSTLSLTEKMALFNRLSHATDKTTQHPEGTRGDTRLRRANARFQTQPITQGEVEQVK